MINSIKVCKANGLYIVSIDSFKVIISCCEVINLSKCYATKIVSSGMYAPRQQGMTL